MKSSSMKLATSNVKASNKKPSWSGIKTRILKKPAAIVMKPMKKPAAYKEVHQETGCWLRVPVAQTRCQEDDAETIHQQETVSP
eukprot:3633673-Amphidinium_carterae.1